MRPSPNIIAILQAGRAVAALVVVVYHAAASTIDFVSPLPQAVQTVTSRGYLGVDFFFVLSGFIIYFTNLNHEPTARWSARYAESRLVRIFVPYLPIGVGLGLAYMLLPGLSASQREWSWFATLTLLPTKAEPALLVAWTLQHELIFYFMFWFFAMSRRPLLACFIWAASIIVWNVAAGTPDRPLFVIFGLINLEFLFGMIAARLVAAQVRTLPFAFAGIVLLATYFALGSLEEHRVLFALSLAFLLLPLIRAEQDGRYAVPAIWVLLGNASYAIYLVHLPLISLLARVAPSHWLASVILLFIAGAVAGLVYHLLFERPAITLVRKQLARLRGGGDDRSPPEQRQPAENPAAKPTV